ncbi:MAG: YybH family protein [Gammaproteobacteria bacterium]
MSEQAVETVFKQWRDALNSGDLETFYGLMSDDMVIFDEDIPWRFSKADFENHIGFHVGVWDSFEWVPRELRYQVFGSTGIVSGYSTFRGKPKDAGFRQRFMCFTQTWINDGDGWTLVCWQQGVLKGQIDGASPS